MKKLIVLLFTPVFFLLLTSLVSATVYAAGIDLDKIKPLAEVEYIPEAEFNEATDHIKSVPYGDEFLSFEVRLPKGWTPDEELPVNALPDSNLSQRVFGVVVRYRSPVVNHLRSIFTVEALELTYEIGARNWFINYVLSNGLTIEQVGVETERQVEAIYVELQGDITYVVRVKAIINGPRMVIARYYVPMELYDGEWIQQAQVIKSFKLTNREESGVEKLEIFGFLDQSFFDFPASWTMKTPYIKSIDRMKAMLYHNTVIGKLDGQINIYLTNKQIDTTRAKEIEFYKEKFQIEDYALGDYMETPKLQYHKDMSFGVTQVYKMDPQVAHMMQYELWVSIMEGEEYYYIISLLTPARTEEFYTWARNIEAYRIVVRGIRRSDENVDYFQFIQ